MVTLQNSFHNTTIHVRKTEAELEDVQRILMTGRGEELRKAKRFAASCKRQLCGATGCTCSDDLGRR